MDHLKKTKQAVKDKTGPRINKRQGVLNIKDAANQFTRSGTRKSGVSDGALWAGAWRDWETKPLGWVLMVAMLMAATATARHSLNSR